MNDRALDEWIDAVRSSEPDSGPIAPLDDIREMVAMDGTMSEDLVIALLDELARLRQIVGMR